LEAFEIERFARQMILEHGPCARSEAAKWAAKVLERRDFEAYQFWGRTWVAIEALQNAADT
jgi:hypothetical protein